MSNTSLQKPIWQADAFIILALVLFWPVGLFLMWKYAIWRKWVKTCLSIFFLISSLPILFIWSLIFGLKGFRLGQDIYYSLPFVEKVETYSCFPVDNQWSTCQNLEYNVSFKYPANWTYVLLRPQGIGFSPLKETTRENYIISFNSPLEMESETKARDFAKIGGGIETIVNSLYATYKENGAIFKKNVSIVDGNIIYKFDLWSERPNAPKISLSDEEIKLIFENMVNSFSVRQ